MEWLNRYFTEQQNFPRPQWNEIYQRVDKDFADYDQDVLWQGVARTWVRKIIESLSDEYCITETDNFLLVSNEDKQYVNTMVQFLERCLKRLLKSLDGIASDDGHGKYVVMIFADIDTYYDYVSYYGPQEGTYGLSSGMYLNYGYGHFVFPHQEIDYAEMIVAHEMTHALLNHLPIPVWLNEGLAVSMERMISSFAPPRLTREKYQQHVNFWGKNEIQEFWQGASFGRPDEGQELSYDLAQVLVMNLSENYALFTEFVRLADWQDGGEHAAETVFDISLGDMIYNFLGEGEWWPDPQNWTWPSSD